MLASYAVVSVRNFSPVIHASSVAYCASDWFTACHVSSESAAKALPKNEKSIIGLEKPRPTKLRKKSLFSIRTTTSR